jgi:hypothetical protein
MMGKQIVYRTDGADFYEGQILLPRGDHMNTLSIALNSRSHIQFTTASVGHA